jgi:hypothetical protein
MEKKIGKVARKIGKFGKPESAFFNGNGWNDLAFSF